MSPVADAERARRTAVVLFDGFELLDVFGLVGPAAAPVRSAQGPEAVAHHSCQEAPRPDVVLVPGGIGTRRLVKDDAFLGWLAAWAAPAELVTSVCTGSALLAAAGLLDGYRATSNKRAFDWVTRQGPRVDWVPTARWVEDRDRWTSSGVAAGMDMALAVIARLHGDELASTVADGVELDWHRD